MKFLNKKITDASIALLTLMIVTGCYHGGVGRQALKTKQPLVHTEIAISDLNHQTAFAKVLIEENESLSAAEQLAQRQNYEINNIHFSIMHLPNKLDVLVNLRIGLTQKKKSIFCFMRIY